jgi:hypothetical protein
MKSIVIHTPYRLIHSSTRNRVGSNTVDATKFAFLQLEFIYWSLVSDVNMQLV